LGILLLPINPQDLDNVETPSFDNCGIVAYFASRTEFDCTDLEAPVAVDFSVLDANNNTSTATNVLVTVVDNIKPELTCSSNINAISQNGSPLIVDGIIAPSVSDNCDSEPTITSIRSDEAELSAPFPVDGNVEDFTTELEVGETYMVGNILNVVDESITVSQITGAELVDTTQSGGPFLVVYEVSDGNNTTTITETVLVTNPNPEITSFTLINADTNEDLFDILPDMQIDLNSLPTLNLDIRANASESTMSVRFHVQKMWHHMLLMAIFLKVIIMVLNLFQDLIL